MITDPASFVAPTGFVPSNAQYVEQRVANLERSIAQQISEQASAKHRIYTNNVAERNARFKEFGSTLGSVGQGSVPGLFSDVESLLSGFNNMCRDPRIEEKLGLIEYYLEV